MDSRPLYRLLLQLTLVGLRGTVTVAKFVLTIYTAFYLGLGDLGLYGLVIGASTLVPAIFGFGLTDFVGRRVAHLGLAEAMPLIATRLSVSLAAHLVGQPLAFGINAALGFPIPVPLFLLIGAILLLDHLIYDATDILILRGRIRFASILLFIRAGSWPLAVIAWGLLDASARTIEHIFAGWLAALVLTWVILLIKLCSRSRWRSIALRPRWIGEAVRAASPFYIKDICNGASLFLDRFLISIFLGLELTGVYTFFWSVANVVHTLVIGLIQTHAAPLIQAGQSPDRDTFQHLVRRLRNESVLWATLLAAAALAVVPFLLPYVGRPLLQQTLPVLWLTLLATVLRVVADAYGVVLLALHRDRVIAAISVAGALGSAALNLLLVPFAGLYGAATAFVLVGVGLLTARVCASRSQSDVLHAKGSSAG